MSRDDLFSKAKSAREEEKKREESRSNYSNNFEEVLYTALSNSEPKVIRLLGNPVSMRNGDPFSPKKILFSEIYGDDDKKFHCLWPTDDEGESWILKRIFDKVMKYNWNKEESRRDYIYQKSHPNIFNRVFKNGRMDQTFERGWKPSNLVIANVIDRSMMDIHREKAHTFILSKSASEDKNGKFWYTKGVPYMLYNLIWDDIVEYEGDYNNYDIVIKKFSDDPWYKVFHSVSDRKKIIGELKNIPSFNEEEFDSFCERPLTEEELSWERYNLDDLFKVTSYQKIYNRLKVFIQQVDSAFHTNFFEELESLVEKEKQEYIEKNPPSEKEKEEDKKEEKKTEEKVKESENSSKKKEESITTREKSNERPKKSEVIDYVSKGFPHFNDLSDSEKSLATGLGEDGIIWKDGLKLYKCSNEECDSLAPMEITICPKCGIKYD